MPMLTIPQAMDDEIKKSVYILREFAADAKKGPDKWIPASIFSRAKGIAIISYCKMGCFVSARGGSGIVVAKLPSGGWSAPSAVGIVGLSGGLEFGVETTAIIMMLMFPNAVKAFMRGKNVTLGGGISVAAGPFGRDIEGDVAVKCPAAMYTYAKAKGLFVGINLGGTLVLERKRANEKCYGPGIRAFDILSGKVAIPPQCNVLHDVLKEQSRQAKRKGFQQAVNVGSKAAEKKYGVKGLNKAANSAAGSALAAEERHHSVKSGDTQRESSYRNKSSSTSLKLGKSKFLSSKKVSKSEKSKSGSKASSTRTEKVAKKGPAPVPVKRSVPVPPVQRGGDARAAQPRTEQRAVQRAAPISSRTSTPHSPSPIPPPADSKTWGQALYSFSGQLSCDISFQKDDRIEILTRTNSDFDWWEGRVSGKTGIFPANYIKIMG